MSIQPIEIKHDQTVDAAYIRFSHNEVVETFDFEDERFEDFYADVDEHGEIVGLEVLNYSDHEAELAKGMDIQAHFREHSGFHLR